MLRGASLGVLALLTFVAGACSSTSSGHIGMPPTTTGTEAPTMATVTTLAVTTTSMPAPSALSFAERACSDFQSFIGHWPENLRDQVTAVSKAEAIGKEALDADHAEPTSSAYYNLFQATDAFAGYVGSTSWPQSGAPTDQVPSDVEAVCADIH